MAIRTRITNERRNFSDNRVTIYRTTEPDERGRLALILLEKWGPVLAAPNGEDSAGRQQLRPLTNKEIVDKACDIAEKALQEMERRGWMVKLPDLNEINKERDAKDEERKKESADTEKV